MNYFFALPLPQNVQQAIAGTAADWRSIAGARASWYEAGDYHITLKFLGNQDMTDEPKLIDAAAPIAASTHSFLVRPASVDAFPHLGVPQVLWAGIQPCAELESLAAQINEVMSYIGFKMEKRAFRPHITVARCRLVTQQFEAIPNARVPKYWPTPRERVFPMFTADHFTLLQTRSQQERQNGSNHRYNIVHTFPFGDTHSSPAF